MKGKMKKEEKKEKSAKKRKKARGSTRISFTLIGAFLVPILLIVLLGVLSYQMAAINTRKQYDTSMEGTVKTVGDYCYLLCNTVEDKSTELVCNKTYNKYYAGSAGKTDADAMQELRGVESLLTTVKGTCNYIFSFHSFSQKGGNISSTSGNLPDNAYEEFQKSEEGAYAETGGNKGVWTGYHSYIDEKLSIKEHSYGLSFTRKMLEGEGYLALDISYKKILSMLESIDGGEGSYTALVTKDDREILYIPENGGEKPAEGEKIFAGKDFSKEASQKEESGSKYITLQGKSYLFTHAPAGSTGLMICTLVPKSTILASANAIKRTTMIIVILASIVAMIIGGLIARNISKEVRYLTKSLKRVSDGDFTAEFISRRRDEFAILTNGLTATLGSIREIVWDIKKFSGKVNGTTQQVSATSLLMADSMSNINKSMDELSRGVARQASDSEESHHLMQNFSEKLNEVYENTSKMEESSESTMKSVNVGKDQIGELSVKSEAASEMTRLLVENIADVNQRSNNIGSIIESIQEIAEQTNLLSLNASIEAARAGEAGKGFAVVAEEIRNLADQSSKAGGQIKEIVENIQNTTQKTSDCAVQTENYLKEQADSIKSAIQVFGEIAEDVEQMVEILQKVSNEMKHMMEDKDLVLDSIQSIASISEQAAVSTEEVTTTVNTQWDEAQLLAREAETLRQEVRMLSESMEKFTV